MRACVCVRVCVCVCVRGGDIVDFPPPLYLLQSCILWQVSYMYMYIVHTCVCFIHSNGIVQLSLLRCLPVDLVLMQSEVTLSCLECGRDNATSGLNYGEHRDVWCKRCHVKLSLYVEQCRFIQHQPGTAVLPSTAPSSGKRAGRKAREAVIQVGKPLPEFGTCAHFKKSNRWLR